eukprot:TRINITY_DN36879_c0_g1_i1.p1 TRINITY_DN36879_c0_g1~~TRINITY_DN36879_c0_g1_i1.p1  ORF type:complete len:442 (+),score=86.93 TRINITY_DN36879_c0_g1_i1:53-1327(+)
MDVLNSLQSPDFSKLENCIKWLDQKGVKTKQLVVFFGPTSSGKSSLINELVGAYVQECQDIPTTDRPAVVIKATENEFSRLCGMSLEHLHAEVAKRDRLPLFPKQRPELSPVDPRYGVLYCRSSAPSKHLREYGLPTAKDPDVVVVNEKYVEWVKAPRAKQYAYFAYSRAGTPLYLDTAGEKEETVSSPNSTNHDTTWEGKRAWMNASAFKVICLPCHTAPFHTRFLQVFEDQMLKAQKKFTPYSQKAGALQDAAEKVTEFTRGDMTENRLDVNDDVWRNTVFAFTQMDKSAAKGWRGLFDAVFEGGQPAAGLHSRVHANKVRYLSLPSQRGPIADPNVEEWLDNEWKGFKMHIESSAGASGDGANALVCRRAKEHYLQVRENRSYKKNMPYFIANEEAYYVRQLGEKQKCSGDWWRATVASAS